MSNKSMFETLFAYHWHTNRRLLECAAQLADADYRRHPGYGHGAVHDLLFHILRTDYGWRRALETEQQVAPLLPADYADLAALQAGFASEQQAWDSLLASWDDDTVMGDISLTTRRGDVFPTARWRVLQHVILHGMQHHSELAQLLTASGHSPGDLDFIFFG